jgi:hypothetical protein
MLHLQTLQSYPAEPADVSIPLPVWRKLGAGRRPGAGGTFICPAGRPEAEHRLH